MVFLPKRLIFSGGGTRCLVFLPTLKRLETAGRFQDVGEWWGTSAGALLAALMGITRSASRVHDIMWQTSYEKFRDISLINMMNFTSAWGLDDGHSMVSEIERILELAHEGASKWTLADVSGVHIVVADLNIYETVVCSNATFPTLRIVDAVRASMSLPVMYRPFQCPVNGHIWVDGGLRAAFPWECLPSQQARRDSLGFAFEKSWLLGPHTFTEYIFSMLHFEDPKQITRWKKEWNNILWFPPPPFPAWYVRLQEDDRTLLEALSTSATEQWLRKEKEAEKETEFILESSETPQTQMLSEARCTPLPSYPERHIGGMLDTHLPYPAASQAPSQDSQSHTLPWRRRWSL